MNSKSSMAIAVVVLVVFSIITYSVIAESNSSGSNTSSFKQGYLKVSNDTKQLYYLSNTTQSIQFNITVYTTTTSIFVYDISPLNNSSAVWTNITTLGPDNYGKYPVQNGTTLTLNLTVNQSAVSRMQPFNPITMTGIYTVSIIVIGSNDGVAGFGFGLVKIP